MCDRPRLAYEYQAPELLPGIEYDDCTQYDHCDQMKSVLCRVREALESQGMSTGLADEVAFRLVVNRDRPLFVVCTGWNSTRDGMKGIVSCVGYDDCAGQPREKMAPAAGPTRSGPKRSIAHTAMCPGPQGDDMKKELDAIAWPSYAAAGGSLEHAAVVISKALADMFPEWRTPHRVDSEEANFYRDLGIEVPESMIMWGASPSCGALANLLLARQEEV